MVSLSLKQHAQLATECPLNMHDPANAYCTQKGQELAEIHSDWLAAKGFEK